MIKQKIFEYNFNLNNKEFNFYVNETNIDAYNSISNLNNINLFIHGPRKSGKSLLGYIWSNKFNAIQYTDNFEEIINHNKNILIDNLNSSFNQENLFHILNHSKNNNLRLLITSNYSIDEFNFNLKDLISRLKIFNYISINQPDDDMLLNILTKLFVDKQFIIKSKAIFEYILKRSNRSYVEMTNIVDKLDRLSLEKKRELTIPLIREIL